MSNNIWIVARQQNFGVRCGMIDYRQIGLRIKLLRESESRKWSPAALAEKLDVDRESVRLYELGKSLTLQKLEKIAKVFDVTEEFLIFGGTKVAESTAEEAPGGKDPRAAQIAAHFTWLNEPDKKTAFDEVKSKADANRLMLKKMIGNQIKPPPDEYVDKVLNHSHKRRGKYGRNV